MKSIFDSCMETWVKMVNENRYTPPARIVESAEDDERYGEEAA